MNKEQSEVEKIRNIIRSHCVHLVVCADEIRKKTIKLNEFYQKEEWQIVEKYLMREITNKFHIIPKTDSPDKWVEIENGFLKDEIEQKLSWKKQGEH